MSAQLLPASAARTPRVGAWAPWLVILAAALLTAGVASLGAGRMSIPLALVARILARLPGPEAGWTVIQENIVLLVRAPRILLAAISGAGLAMAGAALQGIFNNPLVAPQILGISGGAAFGGALAILLGQGGVVLMGAAFVFGIAALLMVGLIATVDGRSSTATLVLAGIVVGALFTALVSLVQFLADPNSSLPAIVGWLMGSFATATWQRLATVAPAILVGIAGLFLLRFRVNVLSLGEDEARSFGARVERERWLVFILVALITAGVVSAAGIVGWVGLVIPHATRLLVGHDHRILIPASALLGGTYLIVIDTLARTITAAEIPLGVLTAIVGAPVFAFLLRRLHATGAGL